MRKKIDSYFGLPESLCFSLAIDFLGAKKISLEGFTTEELRGIKAVAFCGLYPSLLIHGDVKIDPYWKRVRDRARVLYLSKPQLAMNIMLSVMEAMERDPVMRFFGTRSKVVFNGETREVEDLTDGEISQFLEATKVGEFSTAKIHKSRQRFNRAIQNLHLGILTAQKDRR